MTVASVDQESSLPRSSIFLEDDRDDTGYQSNNISKLEASISSSILKRAQSTPKSRLKPPSFMDDSGNGDGLQQDERNISVVASGGSESWVPGKDFVDNSLKEF